MTTDAYDLPLRRLEYLKHGWELDLQDTDNSRVVELYKIGLERQANLVAIKAANRIRSEFMILSFSFFTRYSPFHPTVGIREAALTDRYHGRQDLRIVSCAKTADETSEDIAEDMQRVFLSRL